MIIYEFIQWLRLGIVLNPFVMVFFFFAIGVGVGQLYSAFCDWANS